MVKYFLKKRNFFIASSVFFISLCSYLSTLYPTLSAEDSGELITVAATLDIAHPPGYPLYTLIGKIFTIIIPFGNIAWRINAMSAIFAALTILILHQLLLKITKNQIIAASSSLALTFTNAFWAQSIRAEVYTLNTFLFSLILLNLYIWKEKKTNLHLYLAILFFALALSNHHLILLSAIPFAIFAFIQKPKNFLKPKFYLKSLLSLLAGLLPYLYLSIRTTIGGKYFNPAMISHHPLNSLKTFWEFVNRKIYGSTIHTAQMATSTSSQPPTAIHDQITTAIQNNLHIGLQNWTPKQATYIFQLFFEQYYFVALIPFLFGLYALIKKKSAWGWLLILLTIFYTYGLSLFISLEGDTTPGLIYNSKSFILQGLLMIAIISAYGLKKFFNIPKLPAPKRFLTTLLAALLIAMYIPNFKTNDQSDNYLIYDFSKAIIQSIPDHARLYSLMQDNMTFSIYYLQKIEKFQPQKDIRIVYSKPNNEDYLKTTKEKNLNTRIYTDIILHNIPGMKFHANEFLYEVTLANHPQPKEKITPITSFNLRGLNKTNLDYTHQNIKAIYLYKLAMNAEEKSLESLRDQQLKRLLTETPLSIDNIQWAANFYEQKGLLSQSLKFNKFITQEWPEAPYALQAISRIESFLAAPPF